MNSSESRSEDVMKFGSLMNIYTRKLETLNRNLRKLREMKLSCSGIKQTDDGADFPRVSKMHSKFMMDLNSLLFDLGESGRVVREESYTFQGDFR